MPWLSQLPASKLATDVFRKLSFCNKRFLSCDSPVALNIASVLRGSPDGTCKAEPRVIDIVGHVRTIRNQKRRSFVELGDGSTTTTLQALLRPEQTAGLQTGTAVKLSGLWERCPPGKEQSHELHVERVEILGPGNADDYPIQKKYHRPDYLRTLPHLRLRVPFNALLARLRSECDHQIGAYFRNNGFVQVHPPIITSSDCEGGGEVFSVHPAVQSASKSHEEPYFGVQKYLTVSSQLHLEAYVHEHARVWTSSTAFRAEKSDTPRHLSEFSMIEAELRTESLDEVMDHVEGLIQHIASELRGSQVAQELLSSAQGDEDTPDTQSASKLRMIEHRWQGLRKQYWPRITYTDALKYLDKATQAADYNGLASPAWGTGLQLEHERVLAAEIGQGLPVFVTHYPQNVKPFYMLHSDEAVIRDSPGPTAACFDLLLPDISEVVGGSLREHDRSTLRKSMQIHGLLEPEAEEVPDDHSLNWYMDLRRYGSIPHGGFGLGLDRLIGYLAGVDNIKDIVAWPRYHGRCDG